MIVVHAGDKGFPYFFSLQNKPNLYISAACLDEKTANIMLRKGGKKEGRGNWFCEFSSYFMWSKEIKGTPPPFILMRACACVSVIYLWLIFALVCLSVACKRTAHAREASPQRILCRVEIGPFDFGAMINSSCTFILSCSPCR